MCVLEESFPQVYTVLMLFSFFDLCWFTSNIVSACSKSNIFLFAELFCLLLFFEGKFLTSSRAVFLLLPLCPLSAPLSPPCFRMKLWGRSAWPLQVVFLVALVMLCVDPVSAGNRNHRGSTGTPGLALNPSSSIMRG